jgi:hypothetical protein
LRRDQLLRPRRIVPPRSEFSSRFSTSPVAVLPLGDQAITGCGALRSNSVLLAPLEAADVAGVLDHGQLHAEADAEVRDAVLAGVRRLDLALDAALAEATGHEDRIDALENVVPSAFDVSTRCTSS